jgi:hypothetical protein
LEKYRVDDLLDEFVAKHGRESLETPWEEEGEEEEEHLLALYSALTERVRMRMQELDERTEWGGVV